MSEDWRSQFHPLSLDSTERFVYRYRGADRALMEIKNNTLRMAPFPELNDPKEFAEWRFNFAARKDFDPNPNWLELEQQATWHAKNFAKVLCATMDDDAALERGNINSIWGRGFSRPRMWQQYAENYCGACMVFDRAALDAAVRSSVPKGSKLIDHRVRYANKSKLSKNHPALDPFMLDYDRVQNVGMLQAMTEHTELHWQALFFEKATDWQTEKEYRWLIWDVEHKAVCFDFGDALKAVVIGENTFAKYDGAKKRTPEEISMALDDLRDRCARLNVTVWEVRWKNGAPEVIPLI